MAFGAYDVGLVDKSGRAELSKIFRFDDQEIECSPLGGSVQCDVATLEVEIYRMTGCVDGWTLEVIDHEGDSTIWGEDFPTDCDASLEFRRTLETEGIGWFLVKSSTRRE